MNYHFSALRQTRENLLELLLNNSLEDLMLIPDGFNNNMYWNIAHCLATQQLLHYYLSGNLFRIDQHWVNTYKKGTLPNLNVSPKEVEDLTFLLIETSKVLMKDYDHHLFSDYTIYSTSYGIDIRNINEAIIYNNMHESLHYGYAMAQKRAIIGEKF